jgi:hypothetical protein
MGTTNLIEPLEARALFSVVWVNRGNDNFGKYYGKNANLARTLVDKAVAEWNALLPNANAQIHTSAGKLDKMGKATLGWTSGPNTTLDNNGGNNKWYFDANVADNSDFTNVLTSTAAAGNLKGREDFFTTIQHELGHALGFKDNDNPSGTNGSVTTFSKTPIDPNHSAVPNDLMDAIQPQNTRRYITAHDLTEMGGNSSAIAQVEPLFK